MDEINEEFFANRTNETSWMKPSSTWKLGRKYDYLAHSTSFATIFTKLDRKTVRFSGNISSKKDILTKVLSPGIGCTNPTSKLFVFLSCTKRSKRGLNQGSRNKQFEEETSWIGIWLCNWKFRYFSPRDRLRGVFVAGSCLKYWSTYK